jgi:hypothetical protein
MVRATEDPPRSRPTSRHLTSPLTVLDELRRCRLAWRLPPTRSHGGSQGFKSPHLHPTTALVTGLAGPVRRAVAVPGSPSGQQTGSNRERNGQPLLDCGQETERSGHVLNLPITSRMFGVDLDGSRRIEPAHVGCLVGPDGSRRIQKDRLDDQTDDQGHPIGNRCQGKQGSPRAHG